MRRSPPRSGARLRNLIIAAIAVLGGVGLYALLSRLFEVGMAQTYDTQLYARSLWGIAHGHAWNPAYGTHWLGIHANLILLPLAPLTRFFAAWKILTALQGIAWAWVLWLLLRAVGRIYDSGHRQPGPMTDIEKSRVLLLGAWTLTTLVAAPLVANPFFFDVRPEMLGVPLLLAAFLRAHESGGWDRWGVVLILLAGLVREELALFGAAALVGAILPGASPDSGKKFLRWQQRLGVALAIGLVFAAYWFGVRAWLSGGGAELRAGQAVSELFGGGLRGESAAGGLSFRRTLLLAACSTGGGLVLLGWRWFLALAPGLLFVLLGTKQPDNALNFHYALFAAPALVTAAIAGLQTLQHLPLSIRGHQLVLLLAIAAGMLGARAWGAHPLGLRFQAEHFGLQAESRPWQESCHRLLDTVPPHEGAAIAPMFAASFADREDAWSLETLHQYLLDHGTPPPGLQWVALENIRFASLGRVLVMRHDFTLQGIAAGRLALLRAPQTPPQAPGILATQPGPTCEEVQVLWRGAGIALCDAHLQGDRLVARVQRMPPTEPTAPLALTLDVGGVPVGLTAFHGMMDLASIPPGQAVLVRSEARIQSMELRVLLQDRSGRTWEGSDNSGVGTLAPPLRLSVPR